MYDCKAPLSRFYYPDTRRIINAFIIIIIVIILRYETIKSCFYHRQCRPLSDKCQITLLLINSRFRKI